MFFCLWFQTFSKELDLHDPTIKDGLSYGSSVIDANKDDDEVFSEVKTEMNDIQERRDDLKDTLRNRIRR